jgi:hypothetical protein
MINTAGRQTPETAETASSGNRESAVTIDDLAYLLPD